MQADTFGKYGYEYQVKVIAGLLSDANFNSRIYDILKCEYFESEAMQWVVDQSFTYFRDYSQIITLPVIKVEIENIDNTLLKEEVLNVLNRAWSNINSSDLTYIKESVLEFCRNQELKQAIYDSVDLLNDGNFEAIKSTIDAALKKGQDNDVGYDYLNDIESRYEILSRNPISTGWPAVDDLLQGGLSYGELGVIAAPGGAGKSWVLTKIGASALDQGKNVLFISLELNAGYVGLRNDVVLTNISSNRLRDNLDHLKSRLARITGTLHIKWQPTKSLSIIGLRSIIDRMRLLDKMPDVIIIDYADLMKYPVRASQRKDEALQELYEELRGIAGEYQVPIWTATQTKRESLNENIIGAELISESMGKHYTADFMMSLSRMKQDKASNTARFYVIKNRFGKDGLMLLSKMDTERGIIEIFKPKNKDEVERRTGGEKSSDGLDRVALKSRLLSLTERTDQ